MSTVPVPRWMTRLTAAALCVSMAPWSAVQAQRDYKETRSADPAGSVEIDDLTGSVEIEGWDRPEIEVSGTPEGLGQRVRLSGAGNKTTIHVLPYAISGNSGEEIHLIVRVPAKSSVSTSLVSAGLRVKGLEGDAYLRTISGNISGEVNGNLRINTVSGTVQVAARSAQRLEVKTISGNIRLEGGSGEVEVSTVSGQARLDLGALTRGRFKSISGELAANFSLARDGQIEGESVSGSIHLEFAANPGAAFDVQSLSGSIDNCFGPKPTQAQYGPGSKLIFQNGDGRGTVRIATKGGDVKLCTGSAHAAPAAFAVPPKAHCRQDARYVI